MRASVYGKALATMLAALSVPATAQAAAGDWLVRARAIAVIPDDSSGGVTPSFPGAGANVDTAFAPEIDVTYMVTDHIGVELIAATTKHNATGTGTLDGLPLLKTWVLPPTLTVQYHLMPEAAIRPYVGAGINYTAFYSEKAKPELEAAIGDTRVSLSDSWGWALQAGVDVPITEKMFVNLDIKYVSIDTKATLRTGGLTNTVDVSIDPVILGVGVGWRF
ncbi:MAG: OmpW family protein [Sphingomonadales bacterium]